MPSYKEGDRVVITNWDGNPEGQYSGKEGLIKKVLRMDDAEVKYFVDINEPGFFFWDLLCYEGEFEHAKEETNE